MPQIPPFTSDVAAPIDVQTAPLVDPQSFSVGWQALQKSSAELGATLDQAGRAYLEAQRTTAATNAVADGFNKIDDLEQKWSKVPNRQQAVDGFSAEVGQLGDDIVSGISDPQVARHVQNQLTLRAVSGRAAVASAAFGNESSTAVAGLDDHLQDYGHQLAAAQNDTERAAILDAAQAETKGMAAAGYIPAAVGEQKFLAMRQRADYAQADGDLATDPNIALKKLQDPANYPYLDEVRRDTLRIRAQNQVQGNNAVEQGQVRQAFQDNVAAISSTGLPAVPLPESRIRAAFPDAADGMLGELDRARGVYQAVNASALTSPAEDQALIQKWNPQGAGFRDQQDAQATIEKAIDAKYKAIGKDPAGYVLQASPSIRTAFASAQKDPSQLPAAVAALDGAYDRLGVPSYARSVLPASQASDLVSQIVSAPAPQRAAIVTQMGQTYGDLFPRIMGDLVKAKLSPAYETLAALPNAADRVALANGLGDGTKPVEEALPKGAASTINDGVTSDPNFQDFSRSMSYAAGGTAKVGQLADVARRIAYGHVLAGMNPTDAARQAVQSFTTDKYDFWENGGGVARVPKGAEADVIAAAGHVIDNLTPDQLSFPAYLPKNTGADAATNARAAMLTVQKGKWVTNEADNGLVRIDSNGYPVTLANGQRLELPFSSVPAILRAAPPPAPKPPPAHLPGANTQ
jgi:hypothetical protein